MTFEIYTNRLIKRLEHLGYISRKNEKTLSFYLPYFTRTEGLNSDLFNILYEINLVRYVEDLNDDFWSLVEYYDYESLDHLYNLAKIFVTKAKKLQIKKKLEELEKDFQDDKL